MVKGVGLHETEDGAEALGLVEPRTGANTGPNPGAPQVVCIIKELRLDKPGLALVELVERPFEPLVGWSDQRSDVGLEVSGEADFERFDGNRRVG